MVENYEFTDQQTMSPPPWKYLIDACSIISQKSGDANPRTVHASMWRKIEEFVEEKIIVTCSEVKLEVKDEELEGWIGQHECVVIEIDNDIQKNVIKIVNEHPDLIDFSNGKSSTDAFIIATAMKYNLEIITEENKDSPKKIPQICKSYGIPCFKITELAEEESWSF